MSWFWQKVSEYRSGSLSEREKVIREVYATEGYVGVEAMAFAIGKTVEQIRAEGRLFFRQIRPGRRGDRKPRWRKDVAFLARDQARLSRWEGERLPLAAEIRVMNNIHDPFSL